MQSRYGAKQNGKFDFKRHKENDRGQRNGVFFFFKMPAKIYVAPTGYPLLAPSGDFLGFFFLFFFFIFMYSVSKKVGRMAEQLEKLQVEMGGRR